MGEEIKTVADLKAAYPGLVQEVYDSVMNRAFDGIDDRIAAAIAEEKDKYKRRAEAEVAEELAVRDEELLETLRDIAEEIIRIPGVLPGEDEDGDTDGDEPE